MKISDIIKDLQKELKKKGDLDVNHVAISSYSNWQTGLDRVSISVDKNEIVLHTN